MIIYMIHQISTALSLHVLEKELDLLCHHDCLLPELLMLEPKNKSKWECSV